MNHNKLTITNYGKIWGKTYYEDGTWDTLKAFHVKPGAKAKVQSMKEDEDIYELTILFILPQPDSATITIERNSTEVVGKPMYRVKAEWKNILIANELWEISEFSMDKVLAAIKTWLID